MEELDARVSLIDETLKSGLDPIELLATPINSPLTDLPIAYRTRLRINSVEVGVIEPEQYDPVASRTSQCVSLALWNFRRVCDLAKDLREISSAIGFFTVRTPPRILTKGKIGDLVETVLKDADYDDPSNVCFEFPRESVFSDTEAMANAVADGARGKGADVTVYTPGEFSSAMVGDFDAIAFGCPAMGAEVLEESEFDPMFTEVEGSLSGKKIALFGSQGKA